MLLSHLRRKKKLDLGERLQNHPFVSLPQVKDGVDQDARKPFIKRGPKVGDAPAANAADFSDGQPLDPISEEDDESHGAAPRTPCTRKRGGGALYHKLPNEEEEVESEADPLLILLHQHQEAGDVSSRRRRLRAGGTAPLHISTAEVAPDKKDSSDSGVRSGESSSPDQERALLREADGAARKLDATARMSICSEAASEVSLMSSTPDGAGVLDIRLTSDTGGVCNLNRGLAATAAIINNNNNPGDGSNTNTNNSRQRSDASVIADPSAVIIITPGTTAAASIHNQNLRTISMGDERESVL